jgi:hypothetical protein
MLSVAVSSPPPFDALGDKYSKEDVRPERNTSECSLRLNLEDSMELKNPLDSLELSGRSFRKLADAGTQPT